MTSSFYPSVRVFEGAEAKSTPNSPLTARLADAEPMELVQLAKDFEARGVSNMAKRILQVIGTIFRHAIAHGYPRDAAPVKPW